MAVFRHLKCCDGWFFFVFLYSRWGLKRWVSCLLKWKRDRGSILRCRTVGEEKEKILLSSRNEREKNIAEAQRKSFWVSVTDGYFSTLEVFWFADGYSSYIINVLSVILFDSGEVLEPFFFLLVKLTLLTMQLKCPMPESTIRVLRDDCSCTENLVGSWVRKFALERGASFFCGRDIFWEGK